MAAYVSLFPAIDEDGDTFGSVSSQLILVIYHR